MIQFLSLVNGSGAYDAGQLPDSNLPPFTACPFFDDLYDYNTRGDNEGVYYTVNAAQTTVNYTYVLSRGGTYETYNFGVFYDSTKPGIFTYTYVDAGNAVQNYGSSASVGIQGLDANGNAVATQYSYDYADIVPPLTVTCNTNTGVCTGSTGKSATQGGGP